MYRTGGLETNNEVETMEMDGINYVVSDKFRTMLRDSFVDWGTFLEIYHDNLDYVTLFDQLIKLLNIKENENLKDSLIPLIKRIYELPADAHMVCMLKQFVIYEPVSIALHGLFTTIKFFFEELVDRFIISRNRYIELNNTKDKKNDITKLKQYWNEMDEQYNLDSSSIVLLFLNPPKGIKSGLHWNVKDPAKEEMILKLKAAVKAFNYAGFCPKVPHARLKALLEFPLNEFIEAIKTFEPSAQFPDFKKIEEIITSNLQNMPEKIKIKDIYKRDKPSKEIENDKIELAKWYVDAILDLRKQLLPYGRQYEEYFVKKAKIFNTINDQLKHELSHYH